MNYKIEITKVKKLGETYTWHNWYYLVYAHIELDDRYIPIKMVVLFDDDEVWEHYEKNYDETISEKELRCYASEIAYATMNSANSVEDIIAKCNDSIEHYNRHN